MYFDACSTVMMYEKPYAVAITRKMVPVVRRVFHSTLPSAFRLRVR